MVAILAGGATSPRDAPVWVHGAAAIGMGETGVAAIGMVATGMAATGAVVIGMAAIGTTGTAIGVIIDSITASSSLVTSAFQGGGAGDIQDITAMGIRTATTGTAMAIRTDTEAMVTEGMAMGITATVTAMDMATALTANTVLVANTALRLGRE